VIDNTLPPVLGFNPPISIVTLTQKVLKYFGITNIEVSTQVDDLAPFAQGEIVAAEVGESAFDFLEKYAKKRQVILSTDGDGNIVYVRAEEDIVSDFLTFNENANKCNILTADMSVDDSKRFYKYVLSSQSNASSQGIITDWSQSIQPPVQEETYTTATAIDDEIRTTRVFNFVSDTTLKDQKARQDRVEWEKNVRKANGFSYTIVVQDFVTSHGEIWRPNQLVNINDTVNDVYADLLVLTTEFSVDLNGGARTKLVMTTPDAFKILTEKKTKKDKKDKKLANTFVTDYSEITDTAEDITGEGEM
jgi:prophage tail gpP-like protein